MQWYGLDNDKWFKSIFGYGEYWVPAFFRDFPMGSIMRTTSVSESENSFFKRYTKPRCNLMEFILNFNHAIDDQRNNNAKLDYKDSTSGPILATHLYIEKHAATIYTDSKFKEVHEQIMEACYICRVVEMSTNLNIEIFKVMDDYRNSWIVNYDVRQDTYVCGYKLYLRCGILCSHIFFVLKNKDVKLLLEKYYMGRWAKTALLQAMHSKLSDALEEYKIVDAKHKAINKPYSSFFGLVQRIGCNIDHIASLTEAIDEAGNQILGEGSVLSVIEKKKIFDEFYGVCRPDVVDVYPPNIVKTKGSGSRLISRKEKAIRELNKPARRCAKYGQLGHHDARNA